MAAGRTECFSLAFEPEVFAICRIIIDSSGGRAPL